jgi:hypothetical protein
MAQTAAVAEWQFAAMSFNARRTFPEMLQLLKMLQLQLRESCNNDGMRYLQAIGCEGATGGSRRTLSNEV